jgi:cell wall-associated NlpC family hydrolase
MRPLRLIAPVLALFAFAGTAQAATTTPGSTTTVNGGAGLGGPVTAPSTSAQPTVKGNKARIINGLAYAPSYAPMQVKKIIWAGDKIRRKPYIYGGGHGVWNDAGYDCSGSVSYVLHAAGLLKVSMDSTEFESWGQAGLGQWVTVYTNPGHAFIEVAGIRFDTSAEGDPHPAPGTGPRWRPLLQDTSGFQPRHPASL